VRKALVMALQGVGPGDSVAEVKQRFDAEGIGIPDPQRDLHLYVEDGAVKQKLAGPAKATGVSGGANPQPDELDDDSERGSEG
jgi:hypothetical protein